MNRKEYFLKKIKNNIIKLRNKLRVKKIVQDLYNKYGYGYDKLNDGQFLMELQYFNSSQDVVYLATGQSGYFHDQIINNGLGNFKLNPQDIEDAKFISKCFGKETCYSENNIPITYTTLLGTVEFDYATQPFPAGIYEDVFQCDPNHNFPIQPLVGEKEEDFYLRVLEYQIDSYDKFETKNKQEVLNRGRRLIHNFCRFKNKVYLIALDDILDIKASFGDVDGLRNGSITEEEAKQIIEKQSSFSELLDHFNINSNNIYINPNMQSEYGIALYGIIPLEKIQFIEVERKYNMIQKRALDLGYAIGDTIPLDFNIDNNPTFKT